MNGDNREETINNFVLVGNRLLISEGVLSSVYQWFNVDVVLAGINLKYMIAHSKKKV